MFELAVLLLGGFSVGFLGAILGVGGGVFLVPLLVGVLAYNPKTSVIISLFCVVGTSLTSSPQALKKGSGSLKLALFLEIFTILGAFLSANFVHRINDQHLIFMFGVFMLFLSVLVLWSRYKIKNVVVDVNKQEDMPKSKIRLALLALCSFFVGISSGMFGVGGGVLLVPALVLVGGCSLSFSAQMSLMAMLGTSTIALAVHSANQPFPLGLAMVGLLGVLPGGCLGAKVRTRLNEVALRWVFSIFAAIVGIVMIAGI